MKTYTIKIKSTTPLLLSTRQRELDKEIEKLMKSTKERNHLLEKWEDENWRRKAIRDKQGNVIIPERWLRGSFINACKVTGMKPSFEKGARATYTRYAESLFFKNSSLKLKENSLIAYGAYYTLPGQKSSQIWSITPQLEKFENTFEIVDMFGKMPKEDLKELLDYAGAFIGIGAGRKWNFGRYEIIEVKEKK